ncbi:MAG: hypothetical protein ACXU9D_00030 [Xanthobacteraceae bacterium]
MQRLLIGCMAVVSWIHSAKAAQYEVIPTTYDHNVTSSSYNYQATIFDNVGGKVFCLHDNIHGAVWKDLDVHLL